MRNPTDVGTAASSPQECVDLVDAAEPTAIAIAFDHATGACLHSTSIYGYDRGDTGEREYYLRVDSLMKKQDESKCFTTQDAEYVIARLSYGDEQCVEVSKNAKFSDNCFLLVSIVEVGFCFYRNTVFLSFEKSTAVFLSFLLQNG